MDLDHLGGEGAVRDRASPFTAILAFLATFQCLCPASAADKVSDTASQDPNDVKVSKALRSLTEPESPTFQMLGVATNDVQRPDSPKKAALDVLSSLDQNGNLQSGFGIELNPYILIAGPTLTLDQYRRSRVVQQLSYLQVTAGYVKGSSDTDHSAKTSIGLVWTPINGVDPFLNTALMQCIARVRDGSGTSPPADSLPSGGVVPPHGFPGASDSAPKGIAERPPSASAISARAPSLPAANTQIAEMQVELDALRSKADQLQAKIDAMEGKSPPSAHASAITPLARATPEVTPPLPPRATTVSNGGTDTADAAKLNQIAAVKACYNEHPMQPDYHTSLQFGIAPLFVSESGKTGDFKAHGFSASGTLSIGLTHGGAAQQWRGTLLLSGTYRRDEIVPDPATKGAFLQRNRWDLGGRFIYGKIDTVFFSLESAYQRARYLDTRLDSYATIIGGVDIKISDGLWLGLSAGTTAGRSVGGDDTFVGSRFRWGFGQKSAIGEDFNSAGKGG